VAELDEDEIGLASRLFARCRRRGNFLSWRRFWQGSGLLRSGPKELDETGAPAAARCDGGIADEDDFDFGWRFAFAGVK